MKTNSFASLLIITLCTGCEVSRTERSFSIGNQGFNYRKGTDTYISEQRVLGGRTVIINQQTYETYNEWNYGPTRWVPPVTYVYPVTPPPVYWPGRR